MKILNPIPILVCLAVMAIAPRLHGQSFTPAKPYGETMLVNDFICDEMEYPGQDMDKGIEGTVVLGFQVDARGNVSDIKVKEGVSPDIDREAVRIFSLLQWEPAIRLGNPIRSEDEYSIKFNIKKYKRQCKQRGYDRTEFPSLPLDTSLTVYNLNQLDKAPEPIFEDKTMKLGKFISQNLVYPDAAFKQNISGQVELSFVVELHGRPSNIVIESPVGGGCTEEAIRILKLIKWAPGMKGDMAVRSRIPIKIMFKLQNDGDHRVFDNNQGAI